MLFAQASARLLCSVFCFSFLTWSGGEAEAEVPAEGEDTAGAPEESGESGSGGLEDAHHHKRDRVHPEVLPPCRHLCTRTWTWTRTRTRTCTWTWTSKCTCNIYMHMHMHMDMHMHMHHLHMHMLVHIRAGRDQEPHLRRCIASNIIQENLFSSTP